MSRIGRACALVVGAGLVMVLVVQDSVRGAGTPLSDKRHPRIFLTAENLTEYRTKLGGPLRADFQEFVSYLDGAYDTAQMDSEYPFHLRNYAFLYAMGSVPGITYRHSGDQYGAKAVALIRQMVTAGLIGSGGETPFVQVLAVGYDWCYPLLSPGDRTAVVNQLKMAPKAGGPGGSRSAFHHIEIVDRVNYLLSGLAFANDGIDDAEAAARLGMYSTYISGDSGINPARNFIAGSDGGVSVGGSYAVNGTGGNGLVMAELQFAEAWRTANGLSVQEVFASDNEFRYFAQWMAYSILPYVSGSEHILYATHYMDRGLAARDFVELPMALSAMRLYRDIDPSIASLAQWLIVNRTGVVPNSGINGKRKALLANFIFNPGNVTGKSPAELGFRLSKLFRGIGWVVMRTGWTGDSDTAVTYMASPYSRSPAYANVNQGSFTIDRNGPLALNAGRGIHHAFSDSTRGHNTITFVDANEPVGSWPQYWDQGGQRILFGIPAGLSQLVKGSQWDIGGIRASDLSDGSAGRDYDYMSSDLTRAYNGPANNEEYNTSKVKLFTRQFVNFRRQIPDGPDVVVVFDRTETTGTKFDKRWMFHPPGREDGEKAFVVSGHSSVAPGPARHGATAGKNTYDQPNLITITNTAGGSNGRLFWRPLLPANRILVEVGGPDSAGKFSTAGSHEYETAYGAQDLDSGNYTPALAQWVGQYSLELQPKARALYDIFLNVFEATTPSQGAMTNTALVNGTTTVGASIGTRMAVFNRTEGYVTSDTLMVPSAGTYRILLCDLQPGMNYDVNGAMVTAGSAGTAYTTVVIPAGGSLRLAATGRASVVPPATPVGLRIVGR